METDDRCADSGWINGIHLENSLYQMRAADSFSGERVAAMRRLRNRRYRNPADAKVSHAQPPLHGNAGTKNAGKRGLGRWCACILPGFSGPVAELAATALKVASGGVGRNRGPVVAGVTSYLGATVMLHRQQICCRVALTKTASDCASRIETQLCLCEEA